MSGGEVEALSVRLCAASRQHTMGSGYHDAERYGGCSLHEQFAEEVVDLIRIDSQRLAAVEALVAEHKSSVHPAPYTTERALIERLDAALLSDMEMT